jgi:VanZ family protein
MTTRRLRTTAARLLAAWLVVLALVGSSVALVPAVAEVARSTWADVLASTRPIGLLTMADGYTQVAAIALALAPLLPLADVATGFRRRRELLRLAAVLGVVAVVVLTAATAGGAVPVRARLTSLTVAVAVGLALSALISAALRPLLCAHPAGTPRPATRRLAVRSALGYGAFVALVAFTSRPVDSGVTPLLVRLLDRLHTVDFPAWMSYSAVEFTANIVFFVPVGLIVVLLVGLRRWWWGAVAGFVISGSVELGQLLFLPDRFASLDDVLSNTAGALLGALAGVALVGQFAAGRTRT